MKFRFYEKVNGKQLNSFKERNDVIRFLFFKDHSYYNEGSKTRGRKASG